MRFVGHIIAISIVIKYKQGHCDDVLQNHGLDYVRFFKYNGITFRVIMIGWIVINGGSFGALHIGLVMSFVELVTWSTGASSPSLVRIMWLMKWYSLGRYEVFQCAIYHYLSLYNLPVFCKVIWLTWKTVISRGPLRVNLKHLFSF